MGVAYCVATEVTLHTWNFVLTSVYAGFNGAVLFDVKNVRKARRLAFVINWLQRV